MQVVLFFSFKNKKVIVGKREYLVESFRHHPGWPQTNTHNGFAAYCLSATCLL